jgi:hypothetical protein
VIFQVKVFWVVTPCSVVVGYHSLQASMLPLSLLHPEDGGNMDACNFGISPQYYMASQPRTLRLETEDII